MLLRIILIKTRFIIIILRFNFAYFIILIKFIIHSCDFPKQVITYLKLVAFFIEINSKSFMNEVINYPYSKFWTKAFENRLSSSLGLPSIIIVLFPVVSEAIALENGVRMILHLGNLVMEVPSSRLTFATRRQRNQTN